MKKSIVLIATAVAAMAVLSCQKETEAQNNNKDGKLVPMTVFAQSLETKSILEVDDGGEETGRVLWNTKDELSVFDGTANRQFTNSLDADNKEATFTGIVQAEATAFAALYPYATAATYNSSTKVISTVIPTNQEVSAAGSFANDANVCVAYAPKNEGISVDGTSASTSTIMKFKNVGGLVKFRISQDGTHKSVTIKTTDDVALTGAISANAQTGEAQAAAEGSVPKVVIAASDGGYLAAGLYYAVVLPFSEKTVSLTFSDGFGTKTRTSKNTISVERTGIRDLGTIDTGISYPAKYEMIMVGQKDDKYYAALAYDGSSSNFKSAEVAIDGKKVTSDHSTIKMTITPIKEGTYAGMFTIQDANDLYLYAAAANSNNMKGAASIDSGDSANNYYWTISEDGEGGYAIIASESSNRNELRFNYNNGTPLFSCYQSTSTFPNVRLYKWDDADITLPACETPVITCSNNTITITCSSPADATIYYVIGADSSIADPIVGTSLVYDANSKPTITENSYVKAIAVADNYEASEVAGQNVTYTAPGTGVYYEKVTASQDDWSGQYLIVSGTSAANGTITSKWLKFNTVNVENDAIESTTEVDAIAVTIEKVTNESYYTIQFAGGDYLGTTNSNDAIKVNNTLNNTDFYWSFSFANDLVKIIWGTSSTGTRHLRLNGNSGFRTYTSETGNQATLYKLADNSPKITADDITINTALGVTNAEATYSISNFVGNDDVSVKDYTGCVSAAEIVEGKIKYSISPNYGIEEATGTIVLQSAEVEDDVTINVTQAYDDSFTHSGTTGSAPDFVLTIPNNASSADITVTTGVFGYNTSVATANEKDLSITHGAYGDADESPQMITISSNEEAPAAGNPALDLGTVSIYRNNNSGDPQKITITVKKAAAAAAGGNKITIVAPPTDCSVTVSVSGSPISSGDSVAEGAIVTLAGSTTTPAVHAFDSWVVYKTEDANTTISVTNNTFEMPAYAVTIKGVFTTIASITASTVASDNNITVNGTQLASFNVDSYVTISVNSDGNNGKLYNLTSTAEWRLYQTNNAVVTVAVPDGYELKSVKFTFSVANTGVLKYGSSTLTSGTSISVSGSSVQFSVANSGSATNGQVKITAFEVEYK